MTGREGKGGISQLKKPRRLLGHGGRNDLYGGWWYFLGPFYIQWRDDEAELWAITIRHRLRLAWWQR